MKTIAEASEEWVSAMERNRESEQHRTAVVEALRCAGYPELSRIVADYLRTLPVRISPNTAPERHQS